MAGTEPTSAELQARGKVVFGLCGLSDPSLVSCGKFFPSKSLDFKEKLQYYSKHFGCIEIDSSSYAIPSKESIQSWLNSTTKEFKFHFKILSIFCGMSLDYRCLPIKIKESLPDNGKKVTFNSLSEELQDQLWSIFNESVREVHAQNKLGAIIFQFQLSYYPTEKNKRYVEYCRRKLDSKYNMAVEFRDRSWLSANELGNTKEWCTTNKLCLISADDLEHEVLQGDKSTLGCDNPVQLPIILTDCGTSYVYIRLHRRQGSNRLLSNKEVSLWNERLIEFSTINRNILIYFLIGTGILLFRFSFLFCHSTHILCYIDVDDQPIINRQILYDALDEKLKLNWNKVFGSNNYKQLSLTNFLKRKVDIESNNSGKGDLKISRR